MFQDSNGLLRESLGAIAAGASLDDALLVVAGSVSSLLGSGRCTVWLVKPGDVCVACSMASTCHDRTLCLHLKAVAPRVGSESVRVPLVVFRDRVASQGGVVRVGEAAMVSRTLFGPDALAKPDAVLLALPLKGPAGVIGLLSAIMDVAPTPDQLDAVRALADAAVVSIRIADLSSRLQRSTLQLAQSGEERHDVEGLLHAILYGSTEYDVIAEDLEGNITVFSEGAGTTYGYSPDEIIGHVRSDVLYAPEEIEAGTVVEVLTEAMRSGRCEAVVTRLRKNGERFPARATFTVRRDADGDPSGFVIVERDLSTERVSARLNATAAQQVAQLQDHVDSLKASNTLIEREAIELRRVEAELRGRLDRLQEVDDLNLIRIGIIRDLRRKLEVARVRVVDRHPLVSFSTGIGVEPAALFGAGSAVVDSQRSFAFTIRHDELEELDPPG